MKKKSSFTTSNTSFRSPKKPKLIAAVTIGSSAFSFLRGQLRWFSENGWEVSLVSSPDRKAHAAAEREGVSLIGIPMTRGISVFNDATSLFHWVRYLLAERPEALSVGTPKASFLGIIAAYVVRVPRRLYIVRGLRLEGAKKPLSYILWMMEWITMKLATDVFYVSKSLAAECEKRRLFFPGKSWLIGEGSSNGVDVEAIQKAIEHIDRDDLRANHGFRSDDFVIGFIGRITLDKGVNLLLEALESPTLSGKIRLVMLGDVEDEHLDKRIKIFGDQIVSIGWKDDAWAYLPLMDLLILPTKREGFPNVVLEAAAAEIPALTTRATGAVDSVVPDETGILIEYGDVSALVGALNDLAEDPLEARRMGAAAHQRVLTHYKPERIWQGLDEILRNVEHPQFAQRHKGRY